VITAGLEPYLIRPDGVSVVEWIDRWVGEDMRNFQYRRVTINITGETERTIEYEDFGR